MIPPALSLPGIPAMSPSRRAFFGASALGLSGAHALAQDPAPVLRGFEDATFIPSTLFLTWQRDPTMTMTVQWVGTQGETSDTNIYYTTASTVLVPGWPVQKTQARP